MPLTTTALEAGQIVRDRVVDSARRMTKLSNEAHAVTSRAADAVEDGVYTAKRAMRRGVAQLGDLQEEGRYRVNGTRSRLWAWRPASASCSASLSAGRLVGSHDRTN